MFYDPTGHFAISALIIGAIIGAVIGFGTAAYIDYKDDGQIFNGSVKWYDYLGATVLGGAIGAVIGAGISYVFPYINSFLGTTFQIGSCMTGMGELVAVTATGAEIAVGLTALAGIGIMFAELPKHGGPKNGTLSNNNSTGHYDGDGNLTERYDFKGKPHFIKELQEYRLPHTHHYRWRLVEGIWQPIKYWITG